MSVNRYSRVKIFFVMFMLSIRFRPSAFELSFIFGRAHLFGLRTGIARWHNGGCEGKHLVSLSLRLVLLYQVD
jgi:hypothetical protein